MSIGKCAIAAILMDAETRAKTEGAEVSKDWFAWLWNSMRTNDINDLRRNNFNFITFNYDRLFEWKLRQQIENTFLSATPDQKHLAFETIQNRIVHVHGVLGVRNNPNFFYGFGETNFHGLGNGIQGEIQNKQKEFAACMLEYSKGINIVCENSEDNALVAKAKQMIKNQTKLIFLGFSYDKRNIVKIGLDTHTQTLQAAEAHGSEEDYELHPLIGTALGLEYEERSSVERLLNHTIKLDSNKMDSVRFCRSYVSVR